MENQKKYTVNEVAKKLDISRTTVYNKLKADLKEYLIAENNKTYVSAEGFKKLEEMFGKGENPDLSNEVQILKQKLNETEQELNRTVQEMKELKDDVKKLKDQMEWQQQEISGRLLDLIDQQQKLQAMQLQAQQPTEQIVQQPKRGLLSRLWGK